MGKLVSLILMSNLLLPHVTTGADVDAHARAKIDSIEAELNRLKKKVEETSIFRFGLSVGPRTIVWMSEDEEKGFVDASISPVDSTLQLDKRDEHDFFLSAVLAITPARELASDSDCCLMRAIYCLASRATFLVNVNLSNLTSDVEGVGFNQRIEGGFGVGLLLHHNFAIGVTYERVFNRRLRVFQ